MASSLLRHRISLACVAVGILISSPGCLAPGLVDFLTGGGERSGLSPSPVPTPAPPPPSPAAAAPAAIVDTPDSIFRVVAWGMAIVVGALALAFVAKLLNHHGKTDRSGSRPPFYDGPPEQRPPLA